MVESDDEGDAVPESVANYWFADGTEEPVSFSALPIMWTENESVDGKNEEIFVRGSVDNGLQTIHKQVIAWKFDFSDVKPEIRVFTKEKTWIKLQKPRKSYENIIRTILITVHCLNILKRNPELPVKSLWGQLYREFSSYEVRPSQNDLIDHMPLISEAVKHDNTLGKSKFLITFLQEKPRKRKLCEEDVKTLAKSSFIVDDMDDDVLDDGEEDDSTDDDLFDTVCAFCDNGGELLCCEGSCLRSFHATVEAGEESTCDSLGLSEHEVKAMKNFLCKNCEYKQHQCFACGRLGSSDKESSRAEVFRCSSATCGRFYHPRCIAKLLCGGRAADAEDLQTRIAGGETFACPIHKCCVCKGIENKKIDELQFAICRRCPTSYHRKCLPRQIAFEDTEDIEEEGIITRAWEKLLPNRILIYCLKHEIDDELGTPVRDHIKFPEVEGKKTSKNRLAMKSSASNIVSKKSDFTSEDSMELPESKVVSKKSDDQCRTAMKEPKKLSSVPRDSVNTKKLEKVSSKSNSSKKVKMTDASQKSLKKDRKSASIKVDRLSMAEPEEGNASLGERLYALMVKGPVQEKVGKQDTTDTELKPTGFKSTTKKLTSKPPALDADTEQRLLALMKDVASSITLEDVMMKRRVPSTHAYSSKTVVDKTITMGKVEGAVEAVRTALKKLEEGGSIDDATAVCEPEILHQIYKWKSKLRVYLAPFLYGMRYTSFGRHFTKVEKLDEIVDRLHWYVQNGDVIVDFCCGANDFSCLMKKKLEETGKSCSYKNYDILQPKNDFNFEQRDWMTVQPKELPSGSKLIMGLNPPFGVRAALANKFVDKALEFRPKLLILIVPSETERLDQKKTPYDLVWEDEQFLSGKSFYLPGSVNVNDKQMDQWNVKPPVLYLWSHCDWAAQHKSIAEKHGHLTKPGEESILYHLKEDQGYSTALKDVLPKQNDEDHKSEKTVTEDSNKISPCNLGDRISQDHLGHGKKQSIDNLKKRGCDGKSPEDRISQDDLGHGKNQSTENPKNRGGDGKSPEDKIGQDDLGHVKNQSTENPKKRGGDGKSPEHRIGQDDLGNGKNQSTKNPNKRGCDGKSPEDGIGQDDVGHGKNQSTKNTKKRGYDVKSPEEKRRSKKPSVNEMYNRIARCSPSNVIDDRSSFDGPRSKSVETCSPMMEGESVYRHFERSMSSSRIQFGAASDDMNRRYNISSGETYLSGMHGIPEEQFTGRVRDGADSLGYRHYASVDRQADIRSQIRIYGQDPDASRYGPMGSLSYGLAGSAGGSSYGMNSAMQRYAPRLDELNPSMMGPFGAERPPMMNRSGYYDPIVPQPSGYRPDSMEFVPGPNRPDSMGFAPGPNHTYPHNSAGWLND